VHRKMLISRGSLHVAFSGSNRCPLRLKMPRQLFSSEAMNPAGRWRDY
jgi:hypothetical protein